MLQLFLLQIGGFVIIAVGMVTIVIATIFAFLALAWLSAPHVVDSTLAGSTSDVFCSHSAELKFFEPLADVSCGEVGFLCNAL